MDLVVELLCLFDDGHWSLAHFAFINVWRILIGTDWAHPAHHYILLLLLGLFLLFLHLLDHFFLQQLIHVPPVHQDEAVPPAQVNVKRWTQNLTLLILDNVFNFVENVVFLEVIRYVGNLEYPFPLVGGTIGCTEVDLFELAVAVYFLEHLD